MQRHFSQWLQNKEEVVTEDGRRPESKKVVESYRQTRDDVLIEASKFQSSIISDSLGLLW